MCDEAERAFSRSHSASALRSLSKQSSDPFRFTGLDAAPKMLSALRSTQTTKRDLSVIMHPTAKAEETPPGRDPPGAALSGPRMREPDRRRLATTCADLVNGKQMF